MILLWQLGVVDTLTMLQFFINCGSQYASIVAVESTGNFSKIGLSVLLSPITGLGTSYKFIRAAQGAAERRARIATLAAFMSTSGRAVTTDPATNAATGATIASLISYMREVNAAGNGDNIPFILSYRTGQLQCMILILVVGAISCIIVYYYVKLLIACCKSGYNAGIRQRHKFKSLTPKNRNLSLLVPV